MSKLSKEEYKEAMGYLKRYNYNCVTILTARLDIIDISSPKFDGLPKAPYSISDSVANSVIRLQEDKRLNKALKEWQIVRRALELTDTITKEIFTEEFEKGENNRWNIIDKLNISEDQYKRRRRKLIYIVNDEIKK